MIQTFKEAAFLSNFFCLKMETRIAIKLVSIYIKAIVLLQYSSAFPCSLTRLVYSHSFTFPTFVMNILFFHVFPK